MHRRTLLAGLGAGAALAAPSRTRAQSGSVTIVVPFAPGGPTDAVARLMTEPMGRALGQAVLVENVGGGGGTIGAARVAQARPDGGTLLLHNIGMATAATLYRRLPYDPIGDFEPLGLVAVAPMVWMARADLPGVTDFASMIRFVRERGQGVNLANAGLGSASQLCGTLLQASLGVAVTTVSFRGSGPIYPEILGGRIDLYCDQTSSALPQFGGGRIRPLAVATAARLAQLPEVPTAAEAGLPGFAVAIWHGVYAPKGTPAAAAQRLNGALRAAMQDPVLLARLHELGVAAEPLERVTPEAHRAHLAAEIARWRPVLQAAGQFAD